MRPHGDYRTYASGCRCDSCREANRVYMADRRARVAGTVTDEDPRHGSLNLYDNYGCRCSDCTEAKVRGNAKFRARKAVSS